MGRPINGGNLKLSIKQAGLLCVLSFLPHVASAGLIFNFTDSTGNAAADQAFAAAGAMWSSILSDNVTLNIAIGYSSLGAGVLAQTSNTESDFTYSATRSHLIADATSAADAVAVQNLPSGSAFRLLINRTSNDPNGSGSATPYLDADGDANNSTIHMSDSNAKALGLIAGNGAELDGSITFSSDFNFDFDSGDGITAGEYDFTGIAEHELGHLLGFISGVDILDENSPPYAGPYSDDQFTYVSTLDLFRYSADSFAQGAIDWTADDRQKYFSIDGGLDIVTTFATGVNFGDGSQASHWQDGLGIGIMDPTAAPGEALSISSNDIEALDVIGWNVAAPEPASVTLLVTSLAAIFLRRRARGARS